MGDDSERDRSQSFGTHPYTKTVKNSDGNRLLVKMFNRSEKFKVVRCILILPRVLYSPRLFAVGCGTLTTNSLIHNPSEGRVYNNVVLHVLNNDSLTFVAARCYRDCGMKIREDCGCCQLLKDSK